MAGTYHEVKDAIKSLRLGRPGDASMRAKISWTRLNNHFKEHPGTPECSPSNPQGAPQGRLGSVLADADPKNNKNEGMGPTNNQNEGTDPENTKTRRYEL